MKASDIFTHIDRLGMVASHRLSCASMFKLSKHVRLCLCDDESWTLRTFDDTVGTTDILDNEVLRAVSMTDQELLGQIEEEILKGKLEAL